MKKVLMFLIPILLLGGVGAYFAATKGLIQIPGISPKKKAATANYTEQKDANAEEPKPATPEEPPPVVEEKKAPTEDPKLGQAKVAALWNEMDEATLDKLISDWKDEDLAPILSSMSGDKVTKLLALIAQSNPKRASSLTRAIQAEASKIEPPVEGVDD